MCRVRWIRRFGVCGAFVALFLLSAVFAPGQEKPGGKITGSVVDDSTGAPVLNANVFIANTMLGTSSDTSGRFEIKDVPTGSHELVASCIGYAMISNRVELTPERSLSLEMRLRPRTVNLGIVEITAPRPEAWRESLEVFSRLLLGTTPEAAQCRILNPEILSFPADGSGNFLARARGRLVIDNDALGYRMSLSLGEFRSESQWTFADWKVIFEDVLARSPDRRAVVEQKRDEVFYGSLRHFLMSVVRGRVAKEGYVMYHSPNGSRQRLDRVLELNEDDISKPAGAGRRTLQFSGFLVVEYDRSRVEAFSGRIRTKISVLTMEKGAVRIDSRGQILDPYALGVLRDWSKEKLACQLPLEFLPTSIR